MKFGLGIDAGGTYTDAVIYDFDKKVVREAAKARTKKDDLKIGINNVLDRLTSQLLKKVEIVSLSTTLATNAAVEGKMGDGTLILIGCDRKTVSRKREKYGLPRTDNIIFIDGGHNQEGEMISEPNWLLLKQKISNYKENIGGFAVVQKWGMRNPEFEKKAKKNIMKWTGLPVVAAHELLGDLNFLKRASTTLLNVRLIPIIDKYLNAVKVTLKQWEINSPLVIVRGDGSLMSENYARTKPLETILSGPAASVVGGVNITGEDNAVIVDMGGTTTDLALVEDGRPSMSHGSIKIGDWLSGIKSIDLKTIGLGGDSAIRVDRYNNLTIGPQRVIPLSWLVDRYPQLISDLRSLTKKDSSYFEVIYKTKDPGEFDLSINEEEIMGILADRPLTNKKLAEKLGLSVFDLSLGNLKKKEIIMTGSLTPTDIMHITGDFNQWSTEAALIGSNLIAEMMGFTLSEFTDKIKRKIKEEIYLQVIKSLIENRDDSLIGEQESDDFRRLVLMGYRDAVTEIIQKKNCFLPEFTTKYKLIGIGAPIHVFLPEVARVLNTECLIPENAPVANAVGAITGNISAKEEVEIKPIYNISGIKGYNCFSSEERKEFEKYEEALNWAQTQAEKLASSKAKARDAGEVTVFSEIDEDYNNNILLKTVVKTRAVGNFSWF